MPGQAQLSKLCSFTQVIPGYDISTPAAPVPVFFNVVVDAAGNPIPPTSSAYDSTGTGFTGDNSGFIRSFYTGVDLQPVTGVDFVPSVGGGGSTSSGVLRTVSLLGGKLIVRFGDRDETLNPVASLSAGLVSIEWNQYQTPVSAVFTGVSADLNSNEIIIQNIGGKDSNNHTQEDQDGFWPRVFFQQRNRLVSTDPFEQVRTDDEGRTVLDLPITTAGTSRVQVSGLAGDFGLRIQF